jgi:hypothetical protein
MNSYTSVFYILFELIPRNTKFYDDSRGLQALQNTCIIGSPLDNEISEFSMIIKQLLLQLLKKVGKVPQLNLIKLINMNNHARKHAEKYTDLITKIIRWVPGEESQRYKQSSILY